MTTAECDEERERLLRHTALLRARTAALGPPTPYSQDEHTALKDLIHHHQLDLADFRKRCLESGQVPDL